MRALILLAALLGAACQSAAVANVASADGGQPIVLGRGYDIASAALGEVRHVNVYLPAGYATGETRYPVLYLIDGGVDQDFVHIAGLSHSTPRSAAAFREMIVVGIETRQAARA